MADSRNPAAGRAVFTEVGTSGLPVWGGMIDDEKLTQLRGGKAAKVFRQMAENDDVVGAILFAVEMLLRRVDWRVEPATSAPADVEVAEFVESCMDDLSTPWGSFISEVLSMLTYGWASVELVYKRRVGPDERDPARRSRYADGRIGWRKLPLRSQETLSRWKLAEDGGVEGWYQTTDRGEVLLPIEKLLLFRTTSRRNNPEGRSVLRSAYKSWYFKKTIERIEAIGIERDLAGLPMLYVPPELLNADDAEARTKLAAYEAAMRNLRNDEQMTLILPALFDDRGNRLLEFQLAGTGARRLIDTGAVIERYRRAIATTVLADLILLGHEKVGSFALASSKTELFSLALAAWLDEVRDVLNRFAVPRLLRLNGAPVVDPPRFERSDLEKRDVAEFAQGMAHLAQTGWLTPGGEADERYLREQLNLPERAEPA